MKKRASVRVPATTANLGPGFDCLGLALDLWNQVRLELERGSAVTVTGEGGGELSTQPDNLVARAARELFRRAGKESPEVRVFCQNSIPLARGLGSSAAAIVGGLVAANALLDEPLTQAEVLNLAVELEGHPDNVAPALLGGCQVVARGDQGLVSIAVPFPEELYAVLFIPDQRIPTQKARDVLPQQVSYEDASFNIGRAALLVAALATGRLEALRIATQDRLHQPWREPLFPAMRLIFRAALEAGATGVFLSGSGSTILAFTRGRQMTVGYEMADMAEKAGVPGTLRIVRPSLQGATITELE